MTHRVVKVIAVPKSVQASKTFIYITRSTKLYPLLKKVRRELILNNAGRVTICGMGAAIAHASMLALKIQDMVGGEAVCTLDIRTGTQSTLDHVVPEDQIDGLDQTKARNMNTMEIDFCHKKL